MTMLQVLGFQMIATVAIIIRIAIIARPNDRNYITAMTFVLLEFMAFLFIMGVKLLIG